MKLIRRISLFLVLSGIMLLAGGYTALKAERFFYPNRYQTKETRIQEKQQQSAIDGEMKEQVIETAVGSIPVVNADTTYLVEEVDLINGTVHETQESVPVKYIGLDREGLLEELDSYDRNPPLTELERGFETIELTAFSKDRVVICKYYKQPEEDKGFYLMVADHFIVVYREDKQTLYMNTDILLESLNEKLQTEIMQGKYVETEEELYHFLESYSS